MQPQQLLQLLQLLPQEQEPQLPLPQPHLPQHEEHFSDSKVTPLFTSVDLQPQQPLEHLELHDEQQPHDEHFSISRSTSNSISPTLHPQAPVLHFEQHEEHEPQLEQRSTSKSIFSRSADLLRPPDSDKPYTLANETVKSNVMNKLTFFTLVPFLVKII